MNISKLFVFVTLLSSVAKSEEQAQHMYAGKIVCSIGPETDIEHSAPTFDLKFGTFQETPDHEFDGIHFKAVVDMSLNMSGAIVKVPYMYAQVTPLGVKDPIDINSLGPFFRVYVQGKTQKVQIRCDWTN